MESIPLGIDTKEPRFSWNIKAEKRGAGQKYYQIRVHDDNKEFVWDTGKVESDETVNIKYSGKELKSRTKYTWQLNIWDKEDKEYKQKTAALKQPY